MKIKFSKMHGLGNDFVIINNLELQHQFSVAQIRQLAERKFGIGCDQVLVVDRPSLPNHHFFYRIYNSDGSSAGQCGNGARCFIKFVVANKLAANSELTLQTTTRSIHGQVLANGLVAVNMGQPEFMPVRLPLTLSYSDDYELMTKWGLIRFAALSLGNPHAVILLKQPDLLQQTQDLAAISQELQHSSLFPDSVNVNFVYVKSRQQLVVRTYERGSGFTLACGSGACASAVIAIRDKLVVAPLAVQMAGGVLTINWSGGDLVMQGEACHVFDGEIELCV